VNRGAVSKVNLAPTHLPEIGKTRPGTVVSNTVQNTVLPGIRQGLRTRLGEQLPVVCLTTCYPLLRALSS
jgi:mRNA-degrading endonuclease toxin of MazEF toxin-antitoxin module